MFLANKARPWQIRLSDVSLSLSLSRNQETPRTSTSSESSPTWPPTTPRSSSGGVFTSDTPSGSHSAQRPLRRNRLLETWSSIPAFYIIINLLMTPDTKSSHFGETNIFNCFAFQVDGRCFVMPLSNVNSWFRTAALLQCYYSLTHRATYFLRRGFAGLFLLCSWTLSWLLWIRDYGKKALVCLFILFSASSFWHELSVLLIIRSIFLNIFSMLLSKLWSNPWLDLSSALSNTCVIY